MTTRMLAIGLACLPIAACGAALAPAAPTVGPRLDMRLDPPPVHALLGQRTELHLTSTQITALDVVGQEIHAENHPLMVKLQHLDRVASKPQTQQELYALASRIHLNNRRAMEQVRLILTEDQRELTCGLFAGSGSTARALRSVAVPDYGPHATSRSRETLAVTSRSDREPVWNWCTEELPTTASR